MIFMNFILTDWRLLIFTPRSLESTLTFLLAIARFILTHTDPFCAFRPALHRVIHGTFIATYLGFLLCYERYDFEKELFTSRSFPHFTIFVTLLRAGRHHPGSCSMHALIELPFLADICL